MLAPRAGAQTPSADDTMRAYALVERAVRAWSPPGDGASPQPDAPKAVGACVTLKLRGDVVGRGMAWSGGVTGPEGFSHTVLADATRAAMQQAEPRLGAPNDASRDAALKLIAQDVVISVELAGPLSVVEPSTWDDAEITLRPGLDGVAVRIAGRNNAPSGPLHAMYPSHMMLTNMLPHRAMGAMVSLALGEGGAAAALDDPKKLREASGVRMYRFRVGHVAQAGQSGAVLFRGSRLLGPSAALGAQDLRRFAETLAEHLRVEAASQHGSIGIPVPHGAAADAYAQRASLAAYALARYQRWHRSLEQERAVDTDQIVEKLQDHAAIAGAKTSDPVVAASCWLGLQSWHRLAGGGAVREPAGNGSDVPIADWLGKVDAAFTNTTRFVDRLPPSERAFISCALVPDWGQRVDVQSGEFDKISGRLESARASVTPNSIVSMMPWFGWAEVAFDHYHRYISTDWKAFPSQAWKRMDEFVTPGAIPSAVALRRMRDQCWEHQLPITDAGEDAIDMVGGIILSGGGEAAGGRAGSPYPTWQCVRPLAFIATMLRDPRFTEPAERPREIVHLMQAMRFLRQLQVDESSAWMYPDPKLALGGIRASTWDNSLPVDATSMTLLCVTELLNSLAEIANPPAPAPAQPGGK